MRPRNFRNFRLGLKLSNTSMGDLWCKVGVERLMKKVEVLKAGGAEGFPTNTGQVWMFKGVE